MFVHFGLYSVSGQGEWHKYLHNVCDEEYDGLKDKFYVKKNWAKQLVAVAKRSGCKYITLTTRHHDGFSLFDTKGLSTFDAPHSASGRDLIKEFTEACKNGGIVPFFYHTLMDWHEKSYKTDFNAYIDYLVKSVELLCKNYGEVGGFWFDGFWDKPNADWQFDRLYSTIRKYQPKAVIINNTGLNARGEVSHAEIDCVTFERGKPAKVNMKDKYIAGEMCQVLNDHWGYAKDDCNYKSVKELVSDLCACRRYDCNYLLNLGLLGNGGVKKIDEGIFTEIGKWIKMNKNFIYKAGACDIDAENAFILSDGKRYYAITGSSGVLGNENVTVSDGGKRAIIKTDKKIKDFKWLDDGSPIAYENSAFTLSPCGYGRSPGVRVAAFRL